MVSSHAAALPSRWSAGATARGGVVETGRRGAAQPIPGGHSPAWSTDSVFGFQEFMASGLRAIPGIEVFDLEYDVNAFTSTLPRIRIIEIDEFNPLDFI